MQTVSAHGATIPVLGFGTWAISGEACVSAIEAALRIGYRHIDTAAGYRNEKEVGAAIRNSGVRRDEIFITTKVPPDSLEDSAFQRSVDRSLADLGLDQVDLLLIHWPSRTLPVATTIASLNKARARGATRHIGVSNFTVRLLGEAWAATDAPLVTNQCEFHPYLSQDKLIAACLEKGMFFTAFSPLGRAAVLADPVIREIAARKGKSTSQVVLRWDVQQRGIVTIPKSANPAHIKANFEIFDFALTDAEMAAISHLGRGHRHRVANPASAPAWDE